MTQPAEKQWGIPDWRDGASYGDANRWSFNRWRWEFYRRRDDLREDFMIVEGRAKDFLKKQAIDGGDGVLVSKEKPGTSGYFIGVNPRNKYGYEDRLPDPAVSSHPEDLLRFRPDFAPEIDYQDFGDTNLIDLMKSWGFRVSAKQKDFLDNLIPMPIHKGKRWIAFDPRQPIEPQLEVARRWLTVLQRDELGFIKPQRRRHPKKWLGYLRTLDAREAGASWAQIAVLHGHTARTEQTARDIWEQANALRFNF